MSVVIIVIAFSLRTRSRFMGFVFNFFLIWGSFLCGIWKSATFNTDEIQMREALHDYRITELRIDIIVRLFIDFMRDFRAPQIA